jgi:hypothetical protein
MPHFEPGHMSRFELLFYQRLKKKRVTLCRFTADGAEPIKAQRGVDELNKAS